MLAYGLIVSTIVGSLVLIAVTLKWPGTGDALYMRRGVIGGVSTFFLGLGGLMTMQMRSDWVTLGTALLFFAASAWFAVLEWRLSRRR